MLMVTVVSANMDIGEMDTSGGVGGELGGGEGGVGGKEGKGGGGDGGGTIGEGGMGVSARYTQRRTPGT